MGKTDGHEDDIDCYVVFNRILGINSETQLGEDVFLVTSDELGLENEHSLSKLEAILNVGEKCAIANFNGLSDLIMKVQVM